MGRHLNLAHLSEEECEKILQVIQKDFELREKEKERLSKAEEDVVTEISKAGLLTKQKAFNENCCVRCCKTFGIIFNRKATCQVCKLHVCKSCCEYDNTLKGFVCDACFQQEELKLQTVDWFYGNINQRFKCFGSAKVVRSLYKKKGDSDNETDSGYNQSLHSSLQSVTKVRPQLQDVFPGINIGNEEFETVPTNDLTRLSPAALSADKHTQNGSRSYSPRSLTTEKQSPQTLTAEKSIQISHKNVLETMPKDTKDLYKKAFEDTKQAEEEKFRTKFDGIVSELHETLEIQSPRGHMPTQSSASYGDVMVNFEDQVRELLAGLTQRLQMATENFDCCESPADARQRVKQMVSRLVEESLGESLDLTSDEAVSDLSSLSEESGDNKKLFENQLAQAVVFKVLENHRKELDPRLQLDSEDFVDHGQGISKQIEFEKLKSFVREISPRPVINQHQIQEKIERVEEKIVKKQTVDNEEKQNDFVTRCSTFNRVHDNQVPLPDFGPIDFEFSSSEVDPDLLSMNLAPIMEEDEEGVEDNQNTDDWRQNWIFKGSSAISPYSNCGSKKIGEELGEIFMTVPIPDISMGPQIGNRVADELSDLSENNEGDNDSSDGLSDEENSFYAKTSEEIARITRKPRTKKLPVSSISVQTEESDLDSSATSKALSASLSDIEVKSNETEALSGCTSKAEISKSSPKLTEESVPAEGDDPKFEIPPQSMKIVEGEPIKLSCRVAGTAPVDVLWYRVEDSLMELENSESYEISKDANRYQIRMFNMTKAEAGQYMCIAANEIGQCCQYIIITIVENKQDLKPPEFLKGIKDMEVIEGQSIKFRCKVKGYPQPRIVWYKDGQMLKNNNNCKIERFGNRDYILTIDGATIDDDAEYTVMAKNIAGEAKSSAQLIIEPEETVVLQKAQTASVVNKNTPAIPLSPSENKDEQQLLNLGKKLQMTKNKVSVEAENLVYTATEKNAAENIRHMTATALDVLNVTNDVVKSENTINENTHIDLTQNIKHSIQKDTPSSVKDDTNNNTCDTFSKDDNDSQSTAESDGEDSHRSETFINVNSQNMQTSYSSTTSVEIPSAEETSFELSDFSVDVQDFSESEKYLTDSIKKEPMKIVNSRDFYVPSEQRKQQKWEVKLDPYSPSAEVVNKHTDEKIFLTAGKVFTLENKVSTLEDKMDGISDDSSPRHLSCLVDEVARTVAHVEQSEKDVAAIEQSLTGSLSSLSPLSQRGDNSISSLDSGICVQEHPEQTIMYGTTSEEDIPESRAEYNTESGIELPSVNRLKTMFSQGTTDKFSEGADIKRIHSITARSLPKGQLEKIRHNANQGGLSDPVRSSVQSVTLNPVDRILQEARRQPNKTIQAKIAVKLSAPEKQTNRQEENEPTQIFPEEHGDLFPRKRSINELLLEKSVPIIPTPISRPVKMKVTCDTSPKHQSNHLSHSAHKKSGLVLVSPRSGQSEAKSLPMSSPRKQTDNSAVTETASPSVKRMASPRIKSGSILSRAAYWEKKINDGGSSDSVDYPQLLEDCDDNQ